MNSKRISEPTPELWSRIKKSDQAAFNNLYDLYWKQLIKKAYNVVREEKAAQDVVQEVFIDLWERREHLVVNNFAAFINTAVKYKSLSYLKGKNLKVVHLEVLSKLPELYYEVDNQANELKEEVDQAVSQLPDGCRNIFELSREKQLSNQEIADRLKISKRTVETQISKALKFLRKEVLTIF